MSEAGANQAELDRKALEEFLVGNDDLERLEALFDRFNIFEATRFVRQELRHSDFLAFLLDPQGNHGLGEVFVKRLLQRVLTTADGASVAVTPIELELWDLDRIEVRREWQHVDVLLLDEEHKLVVIIENKVDSSERPGQLRRYLEVVESSFPGWRRVPVYLSPNGDTPSHKDYLPVSYGLVGDVLDRLAESRASLINRDVKTLMTHYTEMLRRHIVGDSEIANLCRQIYRKHQRALDLIYEHRPDPQGETRDLLLYLTRSADRLVYKGRHRSLYVYFCPQEWEVSALAANEDSHGFLRFVFHNHPDRLILFLETSPGDEGIRRRLFEMGHKDESVFNELEDPDDSSYPKLYSRTFLSPKFCEDATDEDRETEIRRQWIEFLEQDLPRIDAVLKAEEWIWESTQTGRESF